MILRELYQLVYLMDISQVTVPFDKTEWDMITRILLVMSTEVVRKKHAGDQRVLDVCDKVKETIAELTEQE